MLGARVLGCQEVTPEPTEEELENGIDTSVVVHTMAVAAPYVMYANEYVGSIVDDLAIVDRTRDNHWKVTFHEDAIITVEGLDPDKNLKTVNRIHFARPLDTTLRDLYYSYSYDDGSPFEMFHNRVTKMPQMHRLVRALFRQGIEPYYVHDGLRFAFAFAKDFRGENGETIVPVFPRGWDHSVDPGEIRRFFIVRADEIPELLDEVHIPSVEEEQLFEQHVYETVTSSPAS